MDVIDFARAGAPRPIQKGDRVEIELYEFERGFYCVRADVLNVRLGQVRARGDDGLMFLVPIAQCRILGRAA